MGHAGAGHVSPRRMHTRRNLTGRSRSVRCSTRRASGRVRTRRRGACRANTPWVRQSDGQLLDIVKTNWEPVQNREAFAFFNDFVRAGDMTMETAGSLANGKWVFALARAKAAFRLSRAERDVVESYVLFTNPHQYGRAVDIRFHRFVSSVTTRCHLRWVRGTTDTVSVSATGGVPAGAGAGARAPHGRAT